MIFLSKNLAKNYRVVNNSIDRQTEKGTYKSRTLPTEKHMKAQIPFKESLAVAEAARDKTPYTGFISGLFEADLRLSLFFNHARKDLLPSEKSFCRNIRRVLEETVDPEMIDQTGEIPEKTLEALRAIGAFGIKIPEQYGGKGLSQSAYHKVAELLGSRDASLTVLLSAHNSIGAPEPLKQFGTKEQKKKFLPRIAAGEITGFALTELEVGCDISKVSTYAVRVKHGIKTIGYRITGEKCFITNAPSANGRFLASLLIVIARIVNDPSETRDHRAPKYYGAFIVETNSPGCSVNRFSFEGVRAIYNGAPKFNNVFVPADQLLGTEHDGLRIALTTLTIGRLTLPAACLGAMKQCLWLSRRWAATREQWNAKIGEHTLVGEKLARMAARIFALEALVAMTGIWADEKEDIRLESAGIKILATEWYWETVNDLFQIRGGRGFATLETQRMLGETAIPVGRFLRDARINLIWEGTSEILRLWMGREGMDSYISRGMRFRKVRGLREYICSLADVCAFYARTSLRSIFPHTQMPAEAYRACDAALCSWLHFLEAESANLTKAVIGATLMHREALIKKQLLIRDLVDRALDIFAISAVLWRASAHDMRNNHGAENLALYFCEEMREKFRPGKTLNRRVCAHTKDTRVRCLAKDILDGNLAFLEEGILKIPFD